MRRRDFLRAAGAATVLGAAGGALEAGLGDASATSSPQGVEVIVLRSFTFTGQTLIRTIAMDREGNLWAHDNLHSLYKSTDDAASWSLVWTDPEQTYQPLFLLGLSSGTLLTLTKDSSGGFHIHRSSDGGVTFVKVFDFPAHSLGLLNAQSWVQDPSTGNIFVGEYAPTDQPTVSLYRSTNDGETFEAVLQYRTGQIRHFHNVLLDGQWLNGSFSPFVTGRIWVTIGDMPGGSGTPPKIGYSDDQGETWAWIIQGVYPEARAVGLAFTTEAVYWGNDAPGQPCYVWRYDRLTREVTKAAGPFNGPVNAGGPFYSCQSVAGVLAIFGGVEKRSHGYIGDGFVRWLTSWDGSNWRAAERWSGIGGKLPLVPYAMTAPRADGTFWICYEGLPGTPRYVVNMKCQLISIASLKALVRDQLFPVHERRRIHHLVRSGYASLRFSSLSAGQLTVQWYHWQSRPTYGSRWILVGSGTESFTHAAPTPIGFSLTSAGKQLLQTRRRARITAVATYTPAGGDAIVARKRFMLRR